MLDIHYSDLKAARELEERTGKNAIDFMDIQNDSEEEENEEED